MMIDGWLARWSREWRSRACGEAPASQRTLSFGLALLKSVDQACTTATTVEDATRRCLEIVARLVGCPIAHAYRRRDCNGALASMRAWSIAPSITHDIAQAFIAVSEQLVITPGLELVGQVAAKGRPVACEDVLSHPEFVRTAAARAGGLRASFAVPVSLDGQVEIVLEFFTDRVGIVDEDLLELLTLGAERLGAVVNDNARSAQALDAALAHMSHGLVITDADDRVVLVNPRFLEFYCLPIEAVRPGTPMRMVIEHLAAMGSYPGRNAEDICKVRRSLMASGAAKNYRQVMPSGRTVDVHLSSLGDGKGWVTIHDDVTRQAAAEAVLTEKHRLFDTALCNMAQGLLMLDADLRLIVCNDRFRAMFDLPPEVARPGAHLSDIIGHDLARRVPGASLASMMAERRSLFDSGEPLTLQSVLSDDRVIEMIYNPMPGSGWVATYSDITAHRQAEARVVHMARHDALTGLPNRTQFHERLIQALTGTNATDPVTTAVLCVDLDRLKSVNDALGHAVGDALLRQVTDRLRDTLGDSGTTVARLGGGEFALLLPRVKPEQASGIAKDLIEEVGRGYEIDGQHANVGLSVGIALAPADGRDPEQLLRAAGMALRRAKEAGRGTFRFFEPEMNARMQARCTLELDLRQALADNQFELHYQPVVTLNTDRVSGFEALLRWNHPSRGLVPPAAFIPLAEEVGLMVPLGAWVLREACREAATWPDDVRVAINLSPVQFSGPGLVATVTAALDAAGLDPRRLEVEITEGMLLQESEATLSILHRLKALGVRIAMDDFGTGYSSLSYLQRFPFDKIKIDRSFVTNLATRADAVAIVRAVISLGASLGITTTAEGIETLEQLARLRAEGCTEVQGYLISRPSPARDIPLMLACHCEPASTRPTKVCQAAA